MVTREEVGEGMDEIGGGGTCDEQWVLYMGDESLNSLPETSVTLYVN